MAYAESTIGGTYGGSFRVWVNSIRTRQGDANNNTEDWLVQGGVNRVSTSGGRIYNLNNNNTYTIQLGMNGVAQSGNWHYDSTGTGGVASWGTGATTVGRDGAGNGFGFTSRTDVNMQNGPYVTSGWVQSSDSVATVLRFGGISNISIASPFTDESANPVVTWYNYTGTSHLWFRLDEIDNADSTYHIVSPGNPYTLSGWQTWLRTKMTNTNSSTLYIYHGDDVDNNGSVDNWQGPWTYPVTIANDTGQANPTFPDFTYLDTNSTTVAVTGSNQVLVQTLSTLEATVSTANKATANKNATMSNYQFTIGGYAQNAAWSSGSNVVQTIGTISDVSGVQNLAVKAVDSRGNGTTVTKSVTVLPYSAPGFYGGLAVRYANGYDYTSGLTVDLFNGTTLGGIAAMNLAGTDKNTVNTVSGVKFDVSKDDNTHYTGTKVNVAITNATDHSGYVNTVASTLATAILAKMATLGQDNTTKWFITFDITDKFQTKSYTVSIDIGRPILRIGQDGWLYHNETEMSQAFNNRQRWVVDGKLLTPSVGTWGFATLTGFLWAPYCMINTSDANGDTIYFKEFLSKGTYSVAAVFVATTNAPIVTMTLKGGPWGTSGVPQYNYDLYQASTGENTFTLNNMVVLDAGVFTFEFKANGKNASSTDYFLRVIALHFTKTA